MLRNYTVSFAIFVVLALGACEKYEQRPVGYLTYDYVYDETDKNGEYARRVLNQLYTSLPNGYNRIDNVVLGAATDDAIASENYNNIEILSKSRLNAMTSNPDGTWSSSYATIRQVNLFLGQIDQVPVDPSLLQYWKAEARFIRAMSYFELIKRYGGVPLIGDQLFGQEEKIAIERSSYDACVQYIVTELNAIDPLLRPDPVPDAELGRISQGGARALKSRVLLYAASPLNNPQNDPAKWQAAADAALSVIESESFSLGGNFTNLFVARKNPEIILAFQRDQTIDVERDNAPVGFAEPNQSNGFVSPTQELVDAFPMVNGLPIDDAVSGYDELHPYEGRDPRLSATVFHNGSMWLQRPIETFEGGMDKPNLVQRQTRTGYYMRKFLGDFSNKADYSNQNHNFIIFRYAEILLNYAEAVNELGQTDLAYEPLKLIRDRAGIEPGDNELYGLQPAMSIEEMRNAIRLERRLEMAFEEQRYWDIRRWKIAEEVANGQLHGIQITLNEDSTFSYQEREVFDIRFQSPKNYLYPIPYEEIAGNSVISQNPGY